MCLYFSTLSYTNFSEQLWPHSSMGSGRKIVSAEFFKTGFHKLNQGESETDLSCLRAELYVMQPIPR